MSYNQGTRDKLKESVNIFLDQKMNQSQPDMKGEVRKFKDQRSKSVNNSMSHGSNPRKKSTYIMDDDEDNSFLEGLNGYDPVEQCLMELEDETQVRNQIGVLDATKPIKKLFYNTTQKYTLQNKKLKEANYKMEKEVRSLQSKLDTQVLDHDLQVSTNIEHEKEIEELKEENQKLKITKDAELEFHKEQESELHDYRQKYYNSASTIAALNRNNQEYAKKNAELELDKQRDVLVVRDLKAKVSVMEKTIQLQDASLVEKFQVVDQRLDTMKKENYAVRELGPKLQEIYLQVERDQRASTLSIEDAAGKMEKVSATVEQLERKLDVIEQEKIDGIAEKVELLHYAVTNEIQIDIEDSQKLRRSLDEEKKQLSTSYVQITGEYRGVIDYLKAEYTNLSSLKWKTIKNYLPFFFVSLVIAALLGNSLHYIKIY